MTDEFRRLADNTTGQHGVVTGSQIRDAGITAGQLRGRVQSGILIKSGVHTFRDPLVDRTHLGDVRELVLDCGPDTFVSGPTAAALHHFDGISLRPPFHVTVVRGRNVQRAHHCIHTTSELPPIDREEVEGVPVLSPTRTLLDVARFVSAATLTAALDGALRDGKTTEELLHQRIVHLRSKGRYGIPKLIAVVEGCEASRGGHSWLERRYLELCDGAGLPRPDVQQVLGRAGGSLVRVDCHFPSTNVVVELLGYRWHRTKDQMARDAERLNALLIDGYVPMQFTYDQVTTRPADVVAQTRVALGR